METNFICESCGKLHRVIRSLGPIAPYFYETMSEVDRLQKSELTGDYCVIEDKYFFARCILEIPVWAENEPFVWLVWVSLSRDSFDIWRANSGRVTPGSLKPLFGWLDVALPYSQSTLNLKTNIHLRDGGQRSFVEVERTNHPLAIEQREGISRKRLEEILSSSYVCSSFSDL